MKNSLFSHKNLIVVDMTQYANSCPFSMLLALCNNIAQRAQNGTLILCHAEHLSPQLKQKYSSYLKRHLSCLIFSDTTSHAIETHQFVSNTIKIPPLRERQQDIIALSAFFLKIYAVHHNQPVPSLSQKAIDLLCAFHWPYNVTQLQNVMYGAFLRCKSHNLTEDDVQFKQSTHNLQSITRLTMPNALSIQILRQKLQQSSINHITCSH